MLWLAAPASAESRPIAVVVSRAWNGIDAISLPLLRQLYLGRRSRLGGERVECFDLAPGDPVREGFSRSVFHQSERELQNYWVEQALTGGHLPPREATSVEEMLRRVAERPGAIGYVDLARLQALAPPGVRVLSIEMERRPRPPTAPDYPLSWNQGAAKRRPEMEGSPLEEAATP